MAARSKLLDFGPAFFNWVKVRRVGWQIAQLTIEAATDGDIFLAYVEQVLCPQLPPGDVVAMDNLAAHKVVGVRELIQQAEAEIVATHPDWRIAPNTVSVRQCPPGVPSHTRSPPGARP